MTIISGIDTEKLPTEIRNNPEKLGALLASAKLIELSEENEALKRQIEHLTSQVKVNRA